MSYKCSIYKDRNSICAKYPSKIDAYFFESCQYIKDGKPIDSKLSESEQQKYCMDCGLCCFSNQLMLKNKLITLDMEDEWKKDKCKHLEVIE